MAKAKGQRKENSFKCRGDYHLSGYSQPAGYGLYVTQTKPVACSYAIIAWIISVQPPMCPPFTWQQIRTQAGLVLDVGIVEDEDSSLTAEIHGHEDTIVKEDIVDSVWEQVWDMQYKDDD